MCAVKFKVCFSISDIVVQIVDARNPLLFRCPDLVRFLAQNITHYLHLIVIETIFSSCFQESYVKEVSEHKVNMVLVNKADLLTREQRRVWAKHFEKDGLRAVFWSALAESNRLDAEEKVTRWRRHELNVTGMDWESDGNLQPSASQTHAQPIALPGRLVLMSDTSLPTGHGGGGSRVWRE